MSNKGLANVIDIVGQIDYRYFILGELNEQLDHETPLDKATKIATGFDRVQLETAISAVAAIVRYKKKGGYIHAKDQRFLTELRKIRKTFTPDSGAVTKKRKAKQVRLWERKDK